MVANVKTIQKPVIAEVYFAEDELKVKVEKDGRVVYEVDLSECDDYQRTIDQNLKFVSFQMDKEWRNSRVVCKFFTVLNAAVSQTHAETIRSLCHDLHQKKNCVHREIGKNQKVICQLKKDYYNLLSDCC